MTPPQRKEDHPVAALIGPDILALLKESPADLSAETEEMHPANLADVAETLEPDDVRALLAALPPARAADVLEYLSEELRTEVLETMSSEQAADRIQRFTEHDEQVLEAQGRVRDDRAKVMQTAQEARKELERLFESDAP